MVGDRQAAVAAEGVVWVGNCVQVPGCMANVAVLELVHVSDTAHAAVAQSPYTDTVVSLMATVVSPRAKVHCKADWTRYVQECEHREEQRARSVYSHETSKS